MGISITEIVVEYNYKISVFFIFIPKTSFLPVWDGCFLCYLDKVLQCVSIEKQKTTLITVNSAAKCFILLLNNFFYFHHHFIAYCYKMIYIPTISLKQRSFLFCSFNVKKHTFYQNVFGNSYEQERTLQVNVYLENIKVY